MSQLVPIRGTQVGRTSRTLARLSQDTDVATARAQAAAEVQAAQADGIAAVAARAMQDVSLVSQVEQQLALSVLHASGRLATIGDVAANAIAGVVADTARRICR